MVAEKRGWNPRAPEPGLAVLFTSTPTKGETMHTPTIDYIIEAMPEDCPVRGNALASGDDAVDREHEDRILAELDAGNIWAWCCVKVTATCAGHTGVDYLGCCNYADETDFRREGGYWNDMKEEAKAGLMVNLEAASLLYAELSS